MKDTGELNKIKGMKQSIDHANEKHENWSDEAYGFLLAFIKTTPRFMTEQVREASVDVIPQPPSNRAWGPIIMKASKQGIIYRSGYSQVKNPKAHKANASVWAVN